MAQSTKVPEMLLRHFQSAHNDVPLCFETIEANVWKSSEQLDGFTDFFTNEDVVDTLNCKIFLHLPFKYPDKADHYDMLEK